MKDWTILLSVIIYNKSWIIFVLVIQVDVTTNSKPRQMVHGSTSTSHSAPSSPSNKTLHNIVIG